MNNQTYNKKTFSKFVKENFNTNIVQIKRKYKHTFKVATISKKLAELVGLNSETAYNLGLLHDYARFEQFSKYKSFFDAKTVDHAELACNLLFDYNKIENFRIDNKDYLILYLAIIMHNKKQIDESKIKEILKEHNKEQGFEVVLQYCKLIRDADKIDILRVVTEKDYEISNTENGITPSIKEEIENFQAPTILNSKTKLDAILIQMSYTYLLYFNESYKLFNYKKILNKMVKKYSKILNEEDKAYLKDRVEKTKLHIEKNF